MPDDAPGGDLGAPGLDELAAVPSSWDTVVRRAHVMVWPVVARVCGDDGHADDALQEALIKARRRFVDLEPLGRMLGWIRTTAIRDAIRHLRYGFGAYEQPAGDRTDLAALAPRGAIAAGHEDSTVARLDAAAILDRLDPADQDVLLLAYAGFDGRGIAHVLGMTESAARSRLMRARSRYRHAAEQAQRRAPNGAAALTAWARLRRCVGGSGGSEPAATAATVTTAAASVAALSLFAAVGVTTPSPGTRAPRTPRVPAVAPAPPVRTAGATTPRRAAHPPATSAHRPSQQRRAERGDAGHPGTGPQPARVVPSCLGLCSVPGATAPPDGWRGDRVRAKPLGDDSPGVEQFVVPACAHVPDNPAVECAPGQEPDEYTVKEMPQSPHSGGTP